jgi:Rrf2 family transcriptional regulator, iron-sulfur cluster assembly transcription factor
MRLELTKKTDLAFQALEIIAAHRGERVTGADLADHLDVSAQYLPHVMAPLTRAGWVASVSGPHGGYVLSKDLTEISLLELIEAVEGPIDETRCLHLGPIHTSDASCALHAPWTRARDAMIEELDATRLGDMLPTAR